MLRILHPLAGTVALGLIGTFWLSTMLAELSGSPPTVVAVKTAIPWGFLALVPALAAAGASGAMLSRGRRDGRAAAKLRRMRLIAANGLLVLVPSALFLASRAAAGAFGPGFIAVQAIELIAGATNIVLLSRNLKDGLRMTGLIRAGRA